jgi:hypothetical protein
MSHTLKDLGRIVSQELLLGKSVCSVCGRFASVDHTVDPKVLLTYLVPVLLWEDQGMFSLTADHLLRRVKEDIQRHGDCDQALRRALSLVFARNDT